MKREAHDHEDVMSSLSAVPSPVLDCFDQHKGRSDEIQVVLATDMSLEGSFGEQWLLIDRTILEVVSFNQGKPKLVFTIPLDDIRAAEIEPCVGNGLLRVSVNDQPKVLMHFSNELTDRFALVAHYLRQRIDLGVDAPAPDFETDGQRCLSCGKRLLDPSLKVCPNCIKRGQVMRRLFLLARPYWKEKRYIR